MVIRQSKFRLRALKIKFSYYSLKLRDIITNPRVLRSVIQRKSNFYLKKLLSKPPQLLNNNLVPNIGMLETEIMKGPIIINLPIQKIMFGPIGFRLSCERNFWRDSTSNLLNGASLEEEVDRIFNFFQYFAPKSAAHYYGVEKSDALLKTMSVMEVPVPWYRNDSFGSIGKLSKLGIENDALDQSVKLSFEDGWIHAGPLSKAKISLELSRMWKVAQSVQDVGYLRHNGRDGDISGRIISHGENWLFAPDVGGHRLIALTALGYDTIPVRIDNYGDDWHIDIADIGNYENHFFNAIQLELILSNYINGNALDFFIKSYDQYYDKGS
jgi:hypothetical protein